MNTVCPRGIQKYKTFRSYHLNPKIICLCFLVLQLSVLNLPPFQLKGYSSGILRGRRYLFIFYGFPLQTKVLVYYCCQMKALNWAIHSKVAIRFLCVFSFLTNKKRLRGTYIFYPLTHQLFQSFGLST